jgi:hypothetical protein
LNAQSLQQRRPRCAGIPRTNAGRAALAEYPILQGTSGCAQKPLAIPDDGVADEPAAGLIIYAPWLIVLLLLALVPAFLGEAHFNAQSYSLDYARTPERRELDYIRQTAASVETAKEVKIFGLNNFLIDRYLRLATDFYAANRRLALRRANWGGLFTAMGTVGYYLAYAWGTR